MLLTADSTGTPPVIVKLVGADLFVETGTVVLGRSHTIANGVNVVVANDAEWLIL